MIKILGIVNKDSAVAYHRITMPLILLPDADVFVTNHIDESTFEKGFDIVFYSRNTNDFAFNKLNEMRAKHGFKLIVDVDDYWHLDKWHILHGEYTDSDFAAMQVKHIKNADAVFCTHDRLWAEIKEINSNVYVLPNAIPRIEQYANTKTEPDDRVRLFWQGSSTHEEDINLIRYAIENIANSSRDKIKMVMVGYHKESDVWQRMAKAFTVNGRLRHELYQGMVYIAYYKAYAFADICLTPLVNSRFNSMKSNLKILEAANMGLPVIAHNVHPYKDMPVTYANGTHEWTTALKSYIYSPNKRKEDGERLQEFCSTFFNFNSINQTRKDIFEDVLKKVIA